MHKMALALVSVAVLACGGAGTTQQTAPIRIAPAGSTEASGKLVHEAPDSRYSCHDESKPEYYGQRVGDPEFRDTAVVRLSQFWEDALIRADKDREDPRVQALLDVFVEPMTHAYIEGGDIDPDTRLRMIQLLADTRDPRAKPAWVATLAAYPSEGTKRAMRPVLRGIVASGCRNRAIADALIRAFVELEAGSPRGALTYRDFKEAMVAVSSPTWERTLIDRLRHPMMKITTKDRGNDAKIEKYRNEQFWQVVSAEVLGNIRSKAAVRPLFIALLDPNKADVAATAIMALVKIGPDANPFLLRALRGGNHALEKRAAIIAGDPRKGRARVVRSTALVLGTMGRKDGGAALLQTLQHGSHDALTRVIVAREIAKCPPSKAGLRALVREYESASPTLVIPPGHIAKVALAEHLARIGDASILPRLIRHVDGLPPGRSRDESRRMVAHTLIKLMHQQQVRTVEAAFRRWAPRFDQWKLEKEAFADAKDVLRACGKRVDCYLDKAAAPDTQDKRHQFVGIKSAYMIGMLGTDATRAKIVELLPHVTNAAILFTLGQALDRLAPDGDREAARAIFAMHQEAKASGNRSFLAGLVPLRQIAFRLEARAR